MTVAVVTGASAGIGEEIARRMINRGWDVVAVSRRLPDWTHKRLHAVSADLLDPAAMQEAAAEIARNYEVSHVVHNAGLVWPALVEDVKPEEVAGLTQLHITAPMILTQAVLPGMRKRKFGRIVFVTSRAAMGVPTRTAYSATKAGVHGMARTWALELGPEGITVNVVAPGPVKTDNFYGIVEKGSDREAKIAAQLPVRRLGTVGDVANAVMFFAGEDAGFVTGQVLFVCGGGSLGGLAL
jgi:NAD(P)-dependent dehydrogenase (short-subunit alcohol dehydrogenase family)